MNGPTKVVKTKLFIGNLDPATQPAELSELFAPFGKVLEASVIKDYGFVHYNSIEEAEKAAASLNNKEFHGKRLRVELSTSTVRHRPGQPEPASVLRNSRARAAAMAAGNGLSRYHPTASHSGVGPMRHTPSAWARNDARPYDGIPMDPHVMPAGYGSASSVYDRSRPYDVRSDPRHYYPDRRDSGYTSAYDPSHDNLYAPPTYPSMSTNGSAQATMYQVRGYRELSAHTHPDSMNYNASRMYDRNQEILPADPYYTGSVPQGVSSPVDPYQGYDPYQRYYPGRYRDLEYPIPSGPNPSPRDYDLNAGYRNDPLVTSGSHSVQPPSSASSVRHNVTVDYHQRLATAPPPSQPTSYPPPSTQRQQHAYGTTSRAATASHPSSANSYYG